MTKKASIDRAASYFCRSAAGLDWSLLESDAADIMASD